MLKGRSQTQIATINYKNGLDESWMLFGWDDHIYAQKYQLQVWRMENKKWLLSGKRSGGGGVTVIRKLSVSQ